MDAHVVVGWYAIVVGILVIGMWAGSLATHNVPELATKPWEIRHHIAAELLLATTMVVGGAATLLRIDSGPEILLIGLGMTVYSIVNSSGYYVQRRNLPPVAMFGVLLVLTVLATLALIAS